MGKDDKTECYGAQVESTELVTAWTQECVNIREHHPCVNIIMRIDDDITI